MQRFPGNATEGGMFRNVRVVALITILAQVAGFARTAIMASIFGASSVVDAYNLALVLPVVVAGIVSSWLQTGFVGRYMERLRQSSDDAERFRTSVLQVASAIGIVVAAALLIARPLVTAILVPASSATTFQLTELALVVAVWSLPITIVSDFIVLVLNCHGRFAAAAIAPVLQAIISAVALWAWPTRDINALSITLLLAGIAQVFVLVVFMRRAGLGFSWTFFRLTDDVKDTLRLALPILPGVLFANLTTLVIQATCARLGEGAVALYGYAARLHTAAMQVLVISIGTVLLPQFATLLAHDRRNEIVPLLWRIGRASLVICVFAIAAVGFLGTPAVLVLLGRGHFDYSLAERVGHAWLLLTLGLFPFGLATFFAKLYQAEQRPGLLSISSFISLVATVAACWVAYAISGLTVVLLAPLCAQGCVVAYFLFCFRAEYGQAGLFPRATQSLVRCAMWALPPIACDLMLRRILPAPESVLAVGLRGLLFTGLFFAVAKLSGGVKWMLQIEPAHTKRT